ncbi:GNAT family N-acetyltransferase [Virgisporangium aurantiacum]|uniref:N-acetyltransferase n=1 Tax=Virgisporangium aurantiacum TaxID=175570 RepID=A0A8J3ZCU7_9ACTN|nr:GNAT family N-acetyltransferase [Virgisporangium aurantiacum]GIJ58883.1 N-acetyltransferase [Virgisporangium aurantiacum]
MIVFETPRLAMRLWTADDADRLFDIYSRWEVARWLGATPKVLETREQAVAVASRWSSSWEPPFGVWAVSVRETGVIAGSVLLIPLPGSSDIEVGWHLHPDSQGHGYATEAARAALDRARTAGVGEVFAVVRPGNDPSMAVCRRLGMESIGRTDRWYGVEAEAFRIPLVKVS